MSEQDRELARLWRVSRTSHEMVKDRVSPLSRHLDRRGIEWGREYFARVSQRLTIQGYLVADYEINESLDEFRQRYGGSGMAEYVSWHQRRKYKSWIMNSRLGMSFPCDHETNTGDRIYVYFCPERNVSKQAMKTWAALALFSSSGYSLQDTVCTTPWRNTQLSEESSFTLRNYQVLLERSVLLLSLIIWPLLILTDNARNVSRVSHWGIPRSGITS